MTKVTYKDKSTKELHAMKEEFESQVNLYKDNLKDSTDLQDEDTKGTVRLLKTATARVARIKKELALR